jgi:hypothetical protein
MAAFQGLTPAERRWLPVAASRAPTPDSAAWRTRHHFVGVLGLAFAAARPGSAAFPMARADSVRGQPRYILPRDSADGLPGK